MSALRRILIEMIQAEGPMPVDRFMSLCLTHPQHGYYVTRQPLGREGDFVTAPEISQIFGELIGIWCLSAWEALGRPDPFHLVELGPGRGTLMVDLLRACRIREAFGQACQVHLVEVSPTLREAQRRSLAGSPASHIRWHERLEQVPAGPAIMIANEFIDALPVKQFVNRRGHWFERLVGLNDAGELGFGLAKNALPDALVPGWARQRGEGAIVELSPARRAMAEEMGSRLAQSPSVCLIIDYGHTVPAPGDTLQAVGRHRFVSPLERPGEADITAHVDFAALAEGLRRGSAAVYRPMSQAQFLVAMGLELRVNALQRHQSPSEQEAVALAAQRLVGAEGMGHLFQVLGAGHPDIAPPFPFLMGDE